MKNIFDTILNMLADSAKFLFQYFWNLQEFIVTEVTFKKGTPTTTRENFKLPGNWPPPQQNGFSLNATKKTLVLPGE